MLVFALRSSVIVSCSKLAAAPLDRPRSVIRVKSTAGHSPAEIVSIMTAHVNLFALTFLLLAHHIYSLNILAIFSLPLHSHYMALQPFFNELAARGHRVTVMNNYPDVKPPSNIKYIDMNAGKNFAGYITPMEFYEDLNSEYLHLYNLWRHLELGPNITSNDCENFFNNENVRQDYAKGVKYDVIFVEQFAGECGLAYVGALYDAPIIGVTSHVMLPTAYPRLGIPFMFGSDPFYFSKSGVDSSFYYKVEAVFMNFVYNTFNRYWLQPIISKVFKEYLPDKVVDVEQIAKDRMKMMFVYQHFSLTGSRLLAPPVHEIGGIHIGQLKPLPNHLERFLSDAHHGAIYVSYGSNLKANTMTEGKLQQYLKAFKMVPQKIIWKYENASLPAGNDNVYTGEWMPQLDILCHPKVMGFISHGGMLSLSEAAHCGKPVVVSPFFGDQFSNAAAAEDIGLGYHLPFDKINAESLANAIKAITSQKMQEKAKRITQLWHDRPMRMMDSAIYWTEYVARHASAPPALPSQKTTWFEQSLLDVAIVVLAVILAVVLILVHILKIIKFVIFSILNSIFGKNQPSPSKQSKKSKKE